MVAGAGPVAVADRPAAEAVAVAAEAALEEEADRGAGRAAVVASGDPIE